MEKQNNKVWFEGEKTRTIIFTEEDLNIVLKTLDILSNGHFADTQNEFDRVKTRILFQMMERK